MEDLSPKNKPLYLMFNISFLVVAFGWFRICKTIYMHESVSVILKLPPQFLIWTWGNTLFTYFYLRNRLIAWHIAFISVLIPAILSSVEALLTKDEDWEGITGGVLLTVLFLGYLILRYRDYSDYVKDLSSPM